MRGLRCKIGNGTKASIWGGMGMHPRPLHSSFPDKVSDLIAWEPGSWNMERISSNFWDLDVERIIQVSSGIENFGRYHLLVFLFSEEVYY